METIEIGTSGIIASRIALGTWAIGGWMWGGSTDVGESVDTIRAAIARGITLIDTAPVYGFGCSEAIVGMALAGGLRDRAIIATKAGLEWQDGKVWRNSSPARIRKEVEESLRRLATDYIDLYQIHWPDPLVPIHDTAAVLADLLKEGKIRAIGVSNFSPAQMEQFRQIAPIHSVQPPYNLFEREAEADVFPYAAQHDIAVLCYGALCRGLLAGTITAATRFKGDDLRRKDPKFQEPRFSQYRTAVAALDRYARENGYILLLDYSAQNTPIVNFSPQVDVTQEIVRLYDQAYPVKAGAASQPKPPAAKPAATNPPAAKPAGTPPPTAKP